MAMREYLAGEVAEDYADGFVTRREALHRLGLLGLGVASAAALLAACGGDDDEDDVTGTHSSTTTGPPASSTTTPAAAAAPQAITFAGPNGELQGAFAAAADPKGAVLIVHENRGLTPHFFDLAGRFAASGYTALCVDLLSAQGGTASLTDPGAAPAALASTPVEALVAQLRAGIDELERRSPEAEVGVVGFCFGGGMTWNLVDAGEPRVAAAVPFYGPAPEQPDFGRSDAAVLAIYAGNDERVNTTRDRAVAALDAAGLTYEVQTYDGVDHAFFNDTGPRYDATAAAQAYERVIDWFSRHLA
jgi:carboxymethylenebutenolidase